MPPLAPCHGRPHREKAALLCVKEAQIAGFQAPAEAYRPSVARERG